MLYFAELTGQVVNGLTAVGPVDYVCPMHILKGGPDVFQPDSVWPSTRSCRDPCIQHGSWPAGPAPLSFELIYTPAWANSLSQISGIDPAELPRIYGGISRNTLSAEYDCLADADPFIRWRSESAVAVARRSSRSVGEWSAESFPASTTVRIVWSGINSEWWLVELSPDQRSDPAVPIGDLPDLRSAWITHPRAADVALPGQAVAFFPADFCFEPNGWYRGTAGGQEIQPNGYVAYRPLPQYGYQALESQGGQIGISPGTIKHFYKPQWNGSATGPAEVRRIRCPVDNFGWFEVGQRTTFRWSIENCWFLTIVTPQSSATYKRYVQIDFILGLRGNGGGNPLAFPSARRYRPLGIFDDAVLAEYRNAGGDFVAFNTGIPPMGIMFWRHDVEIETEIRTNSRFKGRARSISAEDETTYSNWVNFDVSPFPDRKPWWGFRISTSDFADSISEPLAGIQMAFLHYSGASPAYQFENSTLEPRVALLEVLLEPI